MADGDPAATDCPTVSVTEPTVPEMLLTRLASPTSCWADSSAAWAASTFVSSRAITWAVTVRVCPPVADEAVEVPPEPEVSEPEVEDVSAVVVAADGRHERGLGGGRRARTALTGRPGTPGAAGAPG